MRYRHHTAATHEDFLRAFSNEALLTNTERAQLRLHYQQPDHAATFTYLGRLMGENMFTGSATSLAFCPAVLARHR